MLLTALSGARQSSYANGRVLHCEQIGSGHIAWQSRHWSGIWARGLAEQPATILAGTERLLRLPLQADTQRGTLLHAPILLATMYWLRLQVQGPWAVKMAVGSKPALIGNKLQLHYSRGPGYFEVDIDIGSSSVASRILSMARETIYVVCRLIFVCRCAMSVAPSQWTWASHWKVCQTTSCQREF